MKFLRIKNLNHSPAFFTILLLNFIFVSGLIQADSQSITQPNSFTVAQPNYNYLSNSSAFKQEIARLEITVARQGKTSISITQVPRLQKDDVLKVRLLDEQVNGTKPDQSNWNWTFSVAFINPGLNKDKDKSVSEEIQFRKTGWYKEYSFVVPYDSQPIFFLYSKPKYRDKISNLVNKNYEEIRKVGEKSIELSNAYSQIGSFLDELQYVVNRNAYGSYGGYGSGYGSSYGSGYGSSYGSGYGSSYGSGYGSSYGSGYGSYGGSYGTTQTLNRSFFMNQSVERLARSFNIQLPNCWQNGSGFGSYGSYGSTTTEAPGTYYGVSQDFIGRSQCVARSVKVEDFDVSVSRMLQQGGILAASSLSIKYPQLSFWINVAAAAIDAINKIKKKSPLRIVPTVNSTNENQAQNSYGYQSNFAAPSVASSGADTRPEPVKISLFAESAPNDDGFVTAYPLVIQKWQANSDPEIISLPTPILVEPCLHPGQNILKSTDLRTDWMTDPFTRNFQLVISSPNGFRKQFPLKKNVGLGGWELNVTKEDLDSFPKINMTIESVVTGNRGFNEIKSPTFDLPISNGGSWEVVSESQKTFAVGDKRVVTLRNLIGNCKCLQSVVYKPSFGGQFAYENLSFSPDNKEVSFIVDATSFQPGQGQLELRQYGGEVSTLSINLYPPPPNISDLKISKGDNKTILYGVGLEQIQAVKINGKRAVAAGANPANPNGTLNAYNTPPTTPLINQGVPAPNYVVSSIPGDKTFIFENPNDRLTANSVSLEIELTENRVFKYPRVFGVSLSRPAVAANEANEIEGVAVADSANKTDSQFSLDESPIFPVKAAEISVNLQNALTDYTFKVENIEIETRIEKGQVDANELPKAEFEVLDWKNLRVDFKLNEQSQKLLAGRRLQFRIRDKERGDSDWYTLKKTFARIPKILSVKCAVGTGGNCQIKGDGIDYISQVSVDGGKTWYPQEPATLTVQPTSDGKSAATIPHYLNKKLLQIRLRDFPSQALVFTNNYLSDKPLRNK